MSKVEAVYFGLFDGHAGYQTSLISSRCLHMYLQVCYFSLKGISPC